LDVGFFLTAVFVDFLTTGFLTFLLALVKSFSNLANSFSMSPKSSTFLPGFFATLGSTFLTGFFTGLVTLAGFFY